METADRHTGCKNKRLNRMVKADYVDSKAMLSGQAGGNELRRANQETENTCMPGKGLIRRLASSFWMSGWIVLELKKKHLIFPLSIAIVPYVLKILV